MVYLVLILALLALLSGISFYFGRKVNTGSGFLLAERSIPWYVNSGSIFLHIWAPEPLLEELHSHISTELPGPGLISGA